MYLLSLKLFSDAQEVMTALDAIEELGLVYTLTPIKASGEDGEQGGRPYLQCDFFFEHAPEASVIDHIADALQRPAKHLVPKSIAPQDWLGLSYDRSAIYESRHFLYTAVDNASALPSDIHKRAIVVNAAHAFGTGGHMSTKLAIDLIEMLYDRGYRPDHCIDFGCGSGILSLSCAALWPETRLTAFDCMDESVQATKLAFEANAYKPAGITIAQGENIPDVLEGAQTDAKADLVLANILPSVLKEKAAQIAQATQAGAYLILSGIIDEKSEDVRQTYTACGFEVESVAQLEGWTAFLMIRA